jgi:3-oxoacyl-[acyl-carrier protein] reductase
VTGATRGIGYAVANRLAKEGASLVIVGRTDHDGVSAVANEISEAHAVPCTGVVADSRSPDEIAEVIKVVRGTHRGLDFLVNNAGIMQDSLIGMITADAITETLETNVSGPILYMQGAARLMRKSTTASIVNMSSIIGLVGKEGQTVYAASKSALVGATRSAAKELAPRGIRVNAVAPGFIDTDLVAGFDDARRAQVLASIGMGRFGTAEDVADVVLFLVSDLSRYVTGQVIGVDGGMLA